MQHRGIVTEIPPAWPTTSQLMARLGDYERANPPPATIASLMGEQVVREVRDLLGKGHPLAAIYRALGLPCSYSAFHRAICGSAAAVAARAERRRRRYRRSAQPEALSISTGSISAGTGRTQPDKQPGPLGSGKSAAEILEEMVRGHRGH